MQGQEGNPANHVVVSVNGGPEVGFGPAKDLTKKQILKEMADGNVSTPGQVEPRSQKVKTLDHVTMHVTAEKAKSAQAYIDARTKSPGNYRLSNRNCAQFAEGVAGAAGASVTHTPVPGVLMKELHLEQKLGIIPK